MPTSPTVTNSFVTGNVITASGVNQNFTDLITFLGTTGVAVYQDDTIVNADISTTAEIAVSKLADGAAYDVLQTNSDGTTVAWVTGITANHIATGAVTTAKILDGTILNADIDAAAEIAVSKLADGAAYDLLGTSSDGTTVAWVSGITANHIATGAVTSTGILDGTILNADINASAAIALSKLASDPVARANHTGTQLASTISDFTTLPTLKSTLTTKGDIYGATAASTPARLAVGSNNQVLTADSAQSTGLKWATPATLSIADGDITGPKLEDAYLALPKLLHQCSFKLTDACTDATYYFGSDGTAKASGDPSAGGLHIYGIASANFAITGLTTKMRIRASFAVNDTDPSMTSITWGLYPVTSTGGSDQNILTLGTVVASSTAAVTPPAAGDELTASSSVFTIPANGMYCIGAVMLGGIAANSIVSGTAYLLYHHER